MTHFPLRSFVGAHAREALLLLSAVRRQRKQPTVVIFPSDTRQGGASNLRGYLVAEELKRLGWNAWICAKHLGLAQRLRVLKFLRPDVLVMQMARHPLNRPRLYNGVPIVFDIDDADYVDYRERAHVIEALEGSSGVIAGSRAVARFCSQYSDKVEIIWTGTPLPTLPPKAQAERGRIIAWATLLPWRCTAEADFLIEVLSSLSKRTRDFRFALYCADGSFEYRALADRFRALGLDVIERPRFTDYSEYLRSLEDVAVGLAPLVDVDGFSGGKSFGKVLAYMASGVPVITSPAVDHPLFFKSDENGFMADTAQEWAAIIARLLDNPEQRQRLADSARADLECRLSTAEAAKRVDEVLRRVIGKRNVEAEVVAD